MYKTFEAQAAAEKERYERRKALRQCVSCGKQDKRTLNGLVRCAVCYEKAKVGARDGERNLYALRKQIGLCVRCGKRDAFTMNGRSSCSACCEKDTERQRKRHGWKPRDPLRSPPEPNIPAVERPSYGLCYFCEAPLAGRVKDNGEPVRVCERCWQRCAKNAANAKRAWFEKRADRTGPEAGA